ncbi:MAG: hypothetical protein V1822_01080 [Candidatus Micrarchaeota archaeon]
MRCGRRGFVFSLDSFVAFSLILIALQSIVVVSSAPSGYYHSLAQANFLAQDTLQVLSNVKYNNGQGGLFGDAAAAGLNSQPRAAEKLILATNDLIPQPYSYAYDYYSFEDEKWHMIYNASKEECNPAYEANKNAIDIGHAYRFCNVTFHRVEAASSMFVGVYQDPIERADSPYCNVACSGYVPGSGYSSNEACTKVPCNVQPASTFDAGDFRLGMIRLRVWG